jgi:hypothetical protein
MVLSEPKPRKNYKRPNIVWNIYENDIPYSILFMIDSSPNRQSFVFFFFDFAQNSFFISVVK